MHTFRFTTTIVLLAPYLLGFASCQRDCAFPTNSDLEVVITGIIETGDSPATPVINVVRYHPLCLAFSRERDRYRAVSVLVEYTCTGNTNCQGDMLLEQIESECDSGVWSNAVLGNNEHLRRRDPVSTFSTNTREDCSFCVSPTLANVLIIPPSYFPDDVHHCICELTIMLTWPVVNEHILCIETCQWGHSCRTVCSDCNTAYKRDPSLPCKLYEQYMIFSIILWQSLLIKATCGERRKNVPCINYWHVFLLCSWTL